MFAFKLPGSVVFDSSRGHRNGGENIFGDVIVGRLEPDSEIILHASSGNSESSCHRIWIPRLV